MRDQRVRLMLVAAWPTLILAALLPFFVAGPPEWGCGEREPVGQAAAVAHFRLVALPIIAASALLAATLILVANRRRRRVGSAEPRRRAWWWIAAGFVAVAAALSTRLGQAWLGLGGAIAAGGWPLTLGAVLLLSGMLLVAGSRLGAGSERDARLRGWYQFHIFVAWFVLAVLAAVFVFALRTDGGPIYC
jgi:hypothetical protein